MDTPSPPRPSKATSETKPVRYAPVIGDCQLTTEDGTVFTGRHDLDIAQQWAPHEAGAERWAQMGVYERNIRIAHALQELRRAAHVAGAI